MIQNDANFEFETPQVDQVIADPGTSIRVTEVDKKTGNFKAVIESEYGGFDKGDILEFTVEDRNWWSSQVSSFNVYYNTELVDFGTPPHFELKVGNSL